MGVMFKRSETFTWTAIKWTFIIMTLFKAGYIVMTFMHLETSARTCATW